MERKTKRRIDRRLPRLISYFFTLGILFTLMATMAMAQTPTCNRVIKADVVAIDQVYTYNRFGVYNPAGMIYALLDDTFGREIMKHGSHGAGAVLIIEPKNSTWTFPDTKTKAIADVTVPATTVNSV